MAWHKFTVALSDGVASVDMTEACAGSTEGNVVSI